MGGPMGSRRRREPVILFRLGSGLQRAKTRSEGSNKVHSFIYAIQITDAFAYWLRISAPAPDCAWKPHSRAKRRHDFVANRQRRLPSAHNAFAIKLQHSCLLPNGRSARSRLRARWVRVELWETGRRRDSAVHFPLSRLRV